MANRINHQDIVKRLLDSKTVDFAAAGKVVAELGPSVALADEPWDAFCGTMRTFFHFYVLPRPLPFSSQLENLSTKIGE